MTQHQHSADINKMYPSPSYFQALVENRDYSSPLYLRTRLNSGHSSGSTSPARTYAFVLYAVCCQCSASTPCITMWHTKASAPSLSRRPIARCHAPSGTLPTTPPLPASLSSSLASDLACLIHSLASCNIVTGLSGAFSASRMKHSATDPAVSLVLARSFEARSPSCVGKNPAPLGGSHTSHTHAPSTRGSYVSPKCAASDALRHPVLVSHRQERYRLPKFSDPASNATMDDCLGTSAGRHITTHLARLPSRPARPLSW
mmetsp:Transcript_3093/g.12247  ORF Transcript_3093/g.12247 Transcript_3093/m.12247 type:complete len:259 (+) Transcript_3093:959-1735(+)